MRIAYLSAGAGSLICGACSHDFLTVASLRRLAHEVRVVPLYTPLHSDIGQLNPASPIFLGGISAYLRVHNPGVAKALRFARPVLDSSALLTIATRSMIETAPAKLGDMTLSVLQGAQGPHAAEFGRLARHIRHVVAPDVVVLTNSMLAPIATTLAGMGEEKPIPVVSGFLGEDSFVMGLPEPYRAQCVELIREHAKHLRLVLCPSRSAAEQAGILLDLKPQQIEVVPAPADVELYTRPVPKPEGIPTVGYLSVIRPAKGLDVLIRALQRVADSITTPIRVLVAGQVVDAKYLRSVRKLATRIPANIQIEFLGEVSLEQKVSVLHQCDVVCTPSRIAETRALAAMEVMASGTALIAPAIGCFPELLAEGGGWLFEPENVDDLARRLIAALGDLALCRSMGEQAAAHVRAVHHPQPVAQQIEMMLSRARTPVRLGQAVAPGMEERI